MVTTLLKRLGQWGASRRVLLAIAACALVAGSWLLLQDKNDPASVERRAADITREHGVLIGYGAPETFYTAPYPATSARIEYVTMSPARLSEVAQALPGIEAALGQYPRGFVSKLIRAIFIAGTLRINDAQAGGTYGPAWILLSAPEGLAPEGIRATSLLGVHHELSSFVYNKDPATVRRWHALLPADWLPARGPAESLARVQAAEPDPQGGFLSAYGATTAENDFNVYAERVFTEPAEIAGLAARHPLVRRKLDVLIEAYAAIDPQMLQTFKRLGVR